MNEHTHDHDHKFVCQPACTVCLKDQERVRSEIEALEKALTITDERYAYMADNYRGDMVPALDAIMLYFGNMKQQLFLQHLNTAAASGQRDAMDIVEMTTHAEQTTFILCILFGQELAKREMDFGEDLYHHTSPKPEQN